MINKHFFKCTLTVLFVMILFRQLCVAQTITIHKESFMNLNDSVMRKEIASFSIKGSSLAKKDSLSKVNLQEISLKKCSENFAYFEKGNLYNSEIIIDLISESESSKTKLKEIRLIYGRYGLVILPDSAITGIYNPKFCEKYTKREKPIKSNCKVLRSEDKRRVYIYLVNREELNPYEVIWILQDEKYYTRVIDYI